MISCLNIMCSCWEIDKGVSWRPLASQPRAYIIWTYIIDHAANPIQSTPTHHKKTTMLKTLIEIQIYNLDQETLSMPDPIETRP